MMTKGYAETRYVFDPGREKVWKAICGDLQKYVRPTDAVLDLGAGYCSFINQISGGRKLAVDIRPECGRFCGPDVVFHAADTDRLPFLDAGGIQVVFLSNILEHLADDKLVSTMAELRRVTSVDATVIVLQPNFRYAYREYFDDYTHVKAFSHVSLVDFFESQGFVSLRVWPKYLPLSMKSTFPKSYWLTKVYLAMPVRPFGKQMLAIFKKKR